MKRLLLLPLMLVAGCVFFSAGCGTDNTAAVPDDYTNSQRSADNPKKLQGAGSGDEEEAVNSAPPPPAPPQL